MKKLLATSGIFGSITDPWGSTGLNVPGYGGGEGQGLIVLLSNLLRAVVVCAGIFSLINLIIAGYSFMAAQGNPDKISEAWNKIWQTLVGLLIVAGSYLLAAIFGYIVFGDVNAIIQPQIYGP